MMVSINSAFVGGGAGYWSVAARRLKMAEAWLEEELKSIFEKDWGISSIFFLFCFFFLFSGGKKKRKE